MKDMNKLIDKYLSKKATLSLNKIKTFVDGVLETKYKDSQWFLNYLDRLNCESVKY